MKNLKYVGKKYINPIKKKKLFKIYKGITELMEKVNRKRGPNAEIQKEIFEKKLIEVFNMYPELLYIQEPYAFGDRITFLYRAIDNKYVNFVKEIVLNNEEVCKSAIWKDVKTIEYLAYYCYNNEAYNNIAYYAVKKFPNLLRVQNKYGYNLGMYVCDRNELGILSKIVYMTINDEVASLQTTKNGNNIGMLCAKQKKQDYFEEAFKNPKARMQINIEGDNMEMIAQNNGLIIPTLSEKQVRDFYEESIYKQVDEICK